jgi:hypothetical protein
MAFTCRYLFGDMRQEAGRRRLVRRILQWQACAHSPAPLCTRHCLVDAAHQALTGAPTGTAESSALLVSPLDARLTISVIALSGRSTSTLASQCSEAGSLGESSASSCSGSRSTSSGMPSAAITLQHNALISWGRPIRPRLQELTSMSVYAPELVLVDSLEGQQLLHLLLPVLVPIGHR